MTDASRRNLYLSGAILILIAGAVRGGRKA
jgi:hypothetical protein